MSLILAQPDPQEGHSLTGVHVDQTSLSLVS